MKKLYVLLILLMAGAGSAYAQWNTNATAKCIFSTANQGIDYATSVLAARTSDKKTWIAWKSWETKEINGIKRSAVRTYLQLLDREGVTQFDEPIMVNDHITPTWWSKYALAVANDGSAIVTVADSRSEEADFPDTQDHASTFTPAIYKISQEGEFLWGLDGVEFTDYNNAAFTYCYVVGSNTYFVFNNESETYSADDTSPNVGYFIQCIDNDGVLVWDAPRKWTEGLPQILPSTNDEMLVFGKTSGGSVVHRLNSQFEEVWSEPVVFDTNTFDGYELNGYKIVSDGDGGACVAFVRNMGQFTHNIRVQHIYADGSLGFGLTGMDAANTEDNDYDYCCISANPKTQEILVDFEAVLPNTANVLIQKFSYDGDYLLEETGFSIASKSLDDFSYYYGLVGNGPVGDGDWIVAYRDVTAWANATFVIRRYDKDNNRTWTRSIGRGLDITNVNCFVEEEATYLIYREGKDDKEPGVKIFRIGNDGSYNVSYTDGIDDVTKGAETGCCTNYFSLDGKRLQRPVRGLNIVKNVDGTTDKYIMH